MENKKNEIVVFGGGCFWCTEAVFGELKGVCGASSGYAGGNTENPTYEEVAAGKTGHAEVVKVEFDPSKISLGDLLTVFFATHDPTTPNRQGNDVGAQYRSIILYTSDQQKKEIEKFIAGLNADGAPVTEVKPLEKFFAAEDYHRRYYERNSSDAYCQIVISPKLKKLKARYSALLAPHT